MGPLNPLKSERPIYFGPGVVIWRGLRLLTDVSKLIASEVTLSKASPFIKCNYCNWSSDICN